MSKYIKYIIISLLLGGWFSALSQNKLIKIADENVKDLQFQQAIENYSKALKKMKDKTLKKTRVENKLADCYRLTNNPKEAVRYYKLISETKFADKTPIIYFNYADVLKQLGQGELAKKYYQKYLTKFPDDILAKNGLTSCEEYLNSTKQSPYIVANQNGLNSIYDDYGAIYSSKKHDQIVLSSNRKGSKGKEKDNWTKGWFSDFYISNYSNGWETPHNADDTEVLNTDANEGASFFDNRFRTMYFTRCEKGENKKVYCQVFQTERSGKRWSRPRLVLSDSSSNVGQPWVSNNELVIYFASDKNGGFGGKDIWMASRKRKSHEFTDFHNLGETVNTPGDEMFPYLLNDTTLYFSSNGHPGYGGLDIFYANYKDSLWTDVKNSLSPINSNADDFAIIFKNEEEGLFSSNRNNGIGGDDIYSFKRKKIKFSVSGTVKDERTLLSLENVNVSLTDNKGKIKITKTNKSGFYKFDSSCFIENNNYSILFSKENYFSYRDSIDTYNFTSNNDFEIDVILDPIPKDPIVLPNILYDLNKWDLKPQYQDSLKLLIGVLNDNPNLVIELRSHTDSRANQEYNDNLSQKRAQTVVDFLVHNGIEPQRLVAKGYGERVPRVIAKDTYISGFFIKKGTALTEKFIKSFTSNDMKKKLFELNRRTEFMVIAKDFKSTHKVAATKNSVVNIINDSLGVVVPYNIDSNGKMAINCYLNDFKINGIIEPDINVSSINGDKVLELMRQGALSKTNIKGDISKVLQNDMFINGTPLEIEKIRIGDIVLNNIKLIVSNEISQSFIFGKDILEKAGSYEINKENSIIIFK